MFTGIVEELGIIKRINRGSKSIELTIKANKVLDDVQIGDSIATNGVCLTVTNFDQQQFSVDVMPETMRKSSLGQLKTGDQVNLERALQVGDRLGGHLVSGHIDGLGEIVKEQREDKAVIISIKPNAELLKYIIPKGSIAIDGISLTIAELKDTIFSVSLIPHTAEITVLGNKGVGDQVNLEADMIGKYVQRMIDYQEEEKTGNDIDKDLLRKNGFLLA
ncbi:riboflavin synthase, alpha subunit [Halobacteroides halobius DSM 5150]|uniref:Riboflavin synthase n=1 Tax=Halobacteroides halobius (strain ATCC 35273 / DSM 5150 / MD-1) TaxID=748449 RepID=L0K938_HALHC|nr:riboflavin synthase [Halobacteroides halobius]AGB40859.1 riboflavin synthase, alpha subunit [Halobacteroides halobius DSM 5150]